MALVLGLTVAGFIVARVLAERDARHESERRVDIAGAEIRSRVESATSLTASLSRFMEDEGATGVTNDQFTTNALRWLNPAGLPAAAWAQEVRAADRAAYERRIGGPIVAPDDRGKAVPSASSYLPASLVSGFPPTNSPGIDLRREVGIPAALQRAIRPGGVGATPIEARSDGTRGLFLVAPAPNLIDGVLRPGAVVVFLSEATLRAAARNPPGLRFGPSARSSPDRAGGDTVRDEFAVAGQQFAVVMPKESVTGPAAALPWIILAGGLLLTALTGSLGAIAARRARAQQDFDRVFSLTPDLMAVTDFDGHLRRINPAAHQVFGYTEEELLARPYLDFVHPEDRDKTAAEAAAIGQGKTSLSFENRIIRKDGSLRVLEWTAAPVVEDGVMYAVARDVTERRQAETESERLAAEQSALRRVAELVAQQAPPERVFAAVTEELSRLLGVDKVRTLRLERDGTVTVAAAHGIPDDRIPPGTNVPVPEGSLLEKVIQTRRPARLDDYSEVRGPVGAVLREQGARSGVGGPIIVDGRLWGAMVVAADEPLPPGSQDRVAQFAELVSTSISNIESRAKVEQLAAEQSALRRVAELVARQAPPDQVFALVTEELSRLLDVHMVWTVRFEPDGNATVLAARGRVADRMPPGTNIPLLAGGVLDQVLRTGRPARLDDYAHIAGLNDVGLFERVREDGVRSGAGGPIVVERRTWGAMLTASETANALPAGTEERVAQFAELVSTAISNIESRAKVERLVAEQSALRRVATLVARAPASEQLLSAVAREVASVLGVAGVIVTRDEADGTVVTLGEAFDSDLAGAERFFGVGTRTPRDPGSLAAQVFETQGPARIDDFSALPGTIGDRARAAGFGSGCAGPIMVNGALWGKMCVFSSRGTVLPAGTENRLNDFIELLATAIANYESRADLAASEALARELANEQASLRRVATLVAEGATTNRVFDAVRDEVEQMFAIPNTILMRFDGDGVATLLATPGEYLGPVGRQWHLEGDDSAVTRVYRTGRAARADYTTAARGPLAEAARRGGTRFPVAVPVVVDGALWGAMSVGSRGPQAPPPDLEGRLEKFTELLATAIANAESRAELGASETRARELASEQAALRRVATLVARQAPPEQVFTRVTEELSHLLDVDLVRTVRFEPDGSVTVLASRGSAEDRLAAGTNVPLPSGTVIDHVFRTGRPARVEDYAQVPGPIGDVLRQEGARSGAGGPIVVDGRLWGAMAVGSTARTLAPGTEDRVAQFAELVSTAISNIESRAKVERLAAEQAALRRVATLVASEHSPDELFATLAEEVRVLLGVDASEILRYEGDATATMVAGWSNAPIRLPVGERLLLDGENLASEVWRTGVPARKEDYSDAPGAIAALSREVGVRSAVASPIVVEGATWGMIAVASRTPEPLPPDTEARLAEFSRVAGLAVANAKSRSELAESRARIVRAADEARRRFERDLHDGAQQRLVSLGLELRAAEATVPSELGEVRGMLSRLGTGTTDVLEDLRELSRGLHPAVLSEDGLSPALRSLALRSAVHVDARIDLDTARFEEPVEVTAYYVASEALTNTAKHAHASRAEIRVRSRDGWLELSVSDDGRGGADAAGGSGLMGLVDRVEAIGGTIQIDSPPGGGTVIHAKLPTGG